MVHNTQHPEESGRMKKRSFLPAMDPSLWSLLKERIRPAEWEEAQLMLGPSLVDETEALHGEVETLQEILDDCQRAATEKTATMSLLSEPPQQREMLMREVRFFVQHIHERRPLGRPLGLGESPREQQLVDYVLTQTEAGRRPATTSSRPRTASSLSSVSSAEVVEELGSGVNVMNLEMVVGRLVSALCEERDALLETVEQLHALIEEVHEQSLDRSDKQPSLHELRQFSTKLQHAYLNMDNDITTGDNKQLGKTIRRLPPMSSDPIPASTSLPLPVEALPLHRPTTSAQRLRQRVQRTREQQQ